MLKKACYYIDEETISLLKQGKSLFGYSQGEAIREAVKFFFQEKQNSNRLCIDIKDDVKCRLRLECVSRGKTLNEMVGELIENGLAVSVGQAQ